MNKVISMAEAAALVPSGAILALGGMTLYRRPAAFVFELLRRPAPPRDLTLLCFTCSYESDLLVGAGLVKRVRTCYFGFEAFGLAPMFTQAANLGELDIMEETEASLGFGLQAAIGEVGFAAGRGWLGTDLPKLRPDVRTIIDPYSGEELMAFPAIRPDVAILHALQADRSGNADLGRNLGVDQELALAAGTVVITTERVVDRLERAPLPLAHLLPPTLPHGRRGNNGLSRRLRARRFRRVSSSAAGGLALRRIVRPGGRHRPGSAPGGIITPELRTGDGMNLEAKVAVVTGASRGIGQAIATELARNGAKVVLNYARDAEGAQAGVEAVRALGGEGCAVQADVSNYKAAEGLIKSALEAYGSVDILVNNAGTTRDMVIMMMPEADWDIVIQTNLKSAFNCSKAAVKTMLRKRSGRIINITSVSGIAGNAGQTNYSASKAGLIGFTRALAREVAARNITVNAVAPGFVPTALTNGLSEELKAASLKGIPLGRWGTPEDVAYAVAFLASPQAGYITGQVLSVDGGMVMS